MADTISVRFDEQTRERLEVESAARGIGISTFVRQLAETELQRVRQERVRSEARAVSTYLAEHPTAFDDDDPSTWAVTPVEVTSALLDGLVGSQVRIVYNDGAATRRSDSKANERVGLLRRVPDQANRFAVGRRLVSLEDVRSVQRIQ